MSTTPLRVGMLGCGTVGTGVLRILRDTAELLETRLGRPLAVTAIAVRDSSAERDEVVPTDLLTTDPESIVSHPDVDVVLELMGGVERASELVLQALASGKQVVTANKAMLASDGERLFRQAESSGRDLLFEAAVGGGMPVIRAIRQSLAGDKARSIHAIINGTSNYILSQMSGEGLAYEDALRGAQERGYAEADPAMDVNGTDAAQKLSILMALAFSVDAPADRIPTRGIQAVTDLDVGYARGFGYALKPLAVARQTESGLTAYVGPCLVPESSAIAKASGALNAVRFEADAVGPLLFEGAGAGMMPTASAVVGDLVDAARNHTLGSQGLLPSPSLGSGTPWSAPAREGRFYVRFAVEDTPGVLGALATGLGQEGVSIAQVVQDLPDSASHVQIALLTHETSEEGLRAAVSALAQESWVLEPPMVMGLEDSL